MLNTLESWRAGMGVPYPLPLNPEFDSETIPWVPDNRSLGDIYKKKKTSKK
jgi:hypothetical protein